MSYWLTKITLLTCKSLVLWSFLQSSTVRANETVLLVLINHKHYVNIQLHIVTCSMYPEKCIQDNAVAPFLQLSAVIVSRPIVTCKLTYRPLFNGIWRSDDVRHATFNRLKTSWWCSNLSHEVRRWRVANSTQRNIEQRVVDWTLLHRMLWSQVRLQLCTPRQQLRC